jgi:hypothetical protein
MAVLMPQQKMKTVESAKGSNDDQDAHMHQSATGSEEA